MEQQRKLLGSLTTGMPRNCAQTLEYVLSWTRTSVMTHKIQSDPEDCATPQRSSKTAASVWLTGATVWPAQCLSPVSLWPPSPRPSFLRQLSCPRALLRLFPGDSLPGWDRKAV